MNHLILPGELHMIDQQTHYARRVYEFDSTALQFSDGALLTYCEYTPEFGGYVERAKDRVVVHVYTD